jgi:hypothetical protein
MYTHVAGPRKGGLDVDYKDGSNKHPKLKDYNGESEILPISLREKGIKPPKSQEFKHKQMIASDGKREFYTDGTRRAPFPYHLFACLGENKGRNRFP